MDRLAVDKINYRMVSDAEAIIEPSISSLTAVFSRNSVAFGG
jgi:hypothetical protein